MTQVTSPDGSNCPHSATCSRAKVINGLIAAFTAALVTVLTGCAWRWSGFGVDLNFQTPAPTQPASPR